MILYGNDHSVRANNLGAALQTSVADLAPMRNSASIPSCVDETLSIWGHGGPDDFAEMSADALSELIKSWKSKNSKFKNIELITCDVRHHEGGPSSYTDKLMPLLITSGKVLVTVKTLPRGGSKATVSELWAGSAPGSDGYFFIAAENDVALAEGNALFTDVMNNLPTGTPVNKRYETAAPLVKERNTKLAMKKNVSFTMSIGPLKDLCSLLVPVTAYRKAGLVKEVPKVLT